MILQHFMLPAADFAFRELYIRGGIISNGAVLLPPGEILSMDTYYNCFSYPAFLRYSVIRNITSEFELEGSALAELCLFDGSVKVVASVAAHAEGRKKFRFSCDITELPEKGFLFVRITADKTGCTFWGCDIRTEHCGADINLCVAVCTYKREEYVKKNIVRLKSAHTSWLNKVFIIDNGGTLDADELSDELVQVVPNRNYGGSGGFTRGLIEAHDGGFSHVVLMDDDIEFAPEILNRIAALVSVLSEKYTDAWISGAMLSELHPYIQYEMGAQWDGESLHSLRHCIDIRDRQELLENTACTDITYGAWWCLCMPVSILDAQGLPMPFFIKFDDVEYGVRRDNSVPVIVQNGIAVTHEDFARKFSIHLEYYDNRNKTITSVVSGTATRTHLVKQMLRSCAKQLFLYRYVGVDLILRAYNDVLRGAEFLLTTDEEALNRELMALAPKCVSLSGSAGWKPSVKCSDYLDDRFFGSGKRFSQAQLLTLGNHLIPTFALKKEPGMLPLSASRYNECFRCRTIIQYQLGSDNGIVFRRSVLGFLGRCFRIAATSFKIITGFGKAKRSYDRNISHIRSMEFWREHLGICDNGKV